MLICCLAISIKKEKKKKRRKRKHVSWYILCYRHGSNLMGFLNRVPLSASEVFPMTNWWWCMEYFKVLPAHAQAFPVYLDIRATPTISSPCQYTTSIHTHTHSDIHSYNTICLNLMPDLYTWVSLTKKLQICMLTVRHIVSSLKCYFQCATWVAHNQE